LKKKGREIIYNFITQTTNDTKPQERNRIKRRSLRRRNSLKKSGDNSNNDTSDRNEPQKIIFKRRIRETSPPTLSDFVEENPPIKKILSQKDDDTFIKKTIPSQDDDENFIPENNSPTQDNFKSNWNIPEEYPIHYKKSPSPERSPKQNFKNTPKRKRLPSPEDSPDQTQYKRGNNSMNNDSMELEKKFKKEVTVTRKSRENNEKKHHLKTVFDVDKLNEEDLLDLFIKNL